MPICKKCDELIVFTLPMEISLHAQAVDEDLELFSPIVKEFVMMFCVNCKFITALHPSEIYIDGRFPYCPDCKERATECLCLNPQLAKKSKIEHSNKELTEKERFSISRYPPKNWRNGNPHKRKSLLEVEQQELTTFAFSGERFEKPIGQEVKTEEPTIITAESLRAFENSVEDQEESNQEESDKDLESEDSKSDKQIAAQIEFQLWGSSNHDGQHHIHFQKDPESGEISEAESGDEGESTLFGVPDEIEESSDDDDEKSFLDTRLKIVEETRLLLLERLEDNKKNRLERQNVKITNHRNEQLT